MTQMNRRPAPAARQNRPAPQRRPVPKRQGGGRWKRDVAVLAVCGLIAAALGFALQAVWPDGFPLAAQKDSGASARVNEIHSEGPLRLNEIMTGNRRTLTAEDGSTPDWVEVANVGTGAVDLAGYSLAKSDGGSGAFRFPQMRLEPGECVLVLADSRLRVDANDVLHAPFRLSSSGDALMLFNAAGTAIDTVNIPALSSDHSYARVSSGEWEISSEPTPGLPNTRENYRILSEPSGESPVVVSEIVASNRTALADENGEYYDYIELYNRSNESVDLAGWHLSDDAAQPCKWRFPEVSIAPGEYMVVYASGQDRRDDPAHLHTNFSLHSEGEQAVLADAQGRVMDCVDYDLLKADVAWTLGADGTWKSAAPSPGRENP